MGCIRQIVNFMIQTKLGSQKKKKNSTQSTNSKKPTKLSGLGWIKLVLASWLHSWNLLSLNKRSRTQSHTWKLSLEREKKSTEVAKYKRMRMLQNICPSRWSKPRHNSLKLNCYCCCWVEFLFYCWRGKLVCAHSKKVNTHISLQVEAEAIILALNLLLSWMPHILQSKVTPKYS